MPPRKGAKNPLPRLQKLAWFIFAAEDGAQMWFGKAPGRRPAGLAFTASAVVLCLGFSTLTYAGSLNQNLSIAQTLPLGSEGTQSIVAGPAATRGAGKKAAGSPKSSSVAPPPTAEDTANTVNRMLAPRDADPSVPLPREDLAGSAFGASRSAGPTMYGRQEPGGAVLGFKIPIPADHGAFDGRTRSGSGLSPQEGAH